MKTPALTKLAVGALEDLKAQDVKVLDVKRLTPMTDVMVICTGTSSRHVKALAQNVVDEAKEHGVRPLGVEGLDQGEWALVDLNGVIVHVMQAQTRAFYQLEKLWGIDPPANPEPEAEIQATRKRKSLDAGEAPARKPRAARAETAGATPRSPRRRTPAGAEVRPSAPTRRTRSHTTPAAD